MDDIKNHEILQVINRIIKNPLLHLPFAGNILAVLKPVMQENGIDAYPVLCLIGAPQSGKTTVAKRIIINRPRNRPEPADNNIENKFFYITTDINVSTLKKILQKRPYDYVVLDDFADFEDNDTKRKAGRFLDQVVRPSYAGSSSLLLITAESGALDKITGSLHSRMIKLHMDNWKYNRKNKQLLEDIFRFQPELSLLLHDFSEWSAKQQLGVHEKNLNFQQKYQGIMDDRSISLFFAYDFSMEVFSKFLTENCRLSFSMSDFRKSYETVWKNISLESLSREGLVKHLFHKLLEDGAFECKMPQAKQLCPKYCKKECSRDSIHICHGDTDQCDVYWQNAECTNENYYDPFELLMDCRNNSAILISNAKYIYGIPKYKKIAVPLLIVPRNSLINMLNDALEKFCLETGQEHNCFGPNEVTSLLNRNHMCLFHISGDHPCYTFQYMAKYQSKKDIPVYILRITQDEYKMARQKNQQQSDRRCMDFLQLEQLYDDYPDTPSKLRLLCQSLQWRYESTNSYSKGQYYDIE